MQEGKNDTPEVRRLTGMLNRLAKQIAERLDKTLLIILTGAIRKLISRIATDADPSKIDYAERLLGELLSGTIEPLNTLDECVEEILWEYNFNSRQYFLFYIRRIAEKAHAEDTVSGKLELLAFEFKKVNQRLIGRNVCYTSTYSSLPDIVDNWLSEEITFLRTKQQLTITFVHPDKPISQDFKIALDLSVAQVSCLVRGLMEKKYILNSNLTELACFLSNAVITKRSENISVGSFRKKYYNLEESTKKSVIDMLNKVIDWLLRN